MNKQKSKRVKPWKSIAYMVSMAWKHGKIVLPSVLVISAWSIGANIVQLYVAPAILQKVEEYAPWQELLGTVVLFSGLLFLLSTLREYASSFVWPNRLAVQLQIATDVSRKTCTTSYPNTSDPEVIKVREGAVRAADGGDDGTGSFWSVFDRLFTHIGCFAVYLWLLADLNVVLASVVVATALVSYFVQKYILGWEHRNKAEKQRYYTQMQYISRKAESVELAKDIRIFGLDSWLREIYGHAMALFEGFIWRREKVNIWANIVAVALIFVRNGVAYAYLIHLALNDGLTASQFLLYFAAVSGFATWVMEIMDDLSDLHTKCLGIAEIVEYLEIPEPFRFEGGREIPKADSYELKLENVTFRYPGAEQNLFENVDLTIRPGEKLAIVGLNGAGKTTLVKILCGLYDPDEGRVLLNGIDIREFNRREYYRLLSAVFQEFSVLETTIAENISQETEDMDVSRVHECLDKAGLTSFVSGLPQGIQTHVGKKLYLDGIQLSGGQIQRLMLARSLYKNGPILVLDEPTAALDPIAEHDIYMKYNEMTKGKTSLFISHRLASTRFCDRIIFLADGKIAEEGSHESLLKLNGEYAKLFEIQSRYYREGGDRDGE